MRAIGVDIGGTTTRAAVVDEHARTCHQTRFATPVDGTGDDLFSHIHAAVLSLERQAATEGDGAVALGVALPGPVDRQRQRVTRSINLPFLADRNIVEDLRSTTDLPVFLMTDADATTWGEYSALASARGCFAHLRLGTGAACGVIADGRLIDLSSGRTDHLDALVVHHGEKAASCRCGKRGCLEAAASGPAILAEAAACGHAADLFEIQREWEKRIAWAVQVVERAGSATLNAVNSIRRTFEADPVVLGGGVIECLPCMLDVIHQLANADRTNDADQSVPAIQRARLGDSAGTIGAALLALQPSCQT